MTELFILAKGRCNSCDKGNRWVTILPQPNSYAPSIQEELEDGYRICRECIYGLQREAAVLARFEPVKTPKPAKPAKKPAKKRAKKVSGVTASSGGGGLP